MADSDTDGHLSIGEVLGVLVEEFPDVTISKIRFLESQGLIAPERTPSGYRKFYSDDVDLLRVILTEQRENYLPLRVIKDRLDSGEIDPTGEHLRPSAADLASDRDASSRDEAPTRSGSNGVDRPSPSPPSTSSASSSSASASSSSSPASTASMSASSDMEQAHDGRHDRGDDGDHEDRDDDRVGDGTASEAVNQAEAPTDRAAAVFDELAASASEGAPSRAPATDLESRASVRPIAKVAASRSHDRPQAAASDEDAPQSVPGTSVASHPAARSTARRDERQPASPRLLPGVMLDAGELCGMVGITRAELEELESFGIVVGRDVIGGKIYTEDAVEIAKPAAALLRAGVDSRHLRAWRTAAEREASLYEQLIAPRLRQRNPEARAEAMAQLRELEATGDALHDAMVRSALRPHFEA